MANGDYWPNGAQPSYMTYPAIPTQHVVYQYQPPVPFVIELSDETVAKLAAAIAEAIRADGTGGVAA